MERSEKLHSVIKRDQYFAELEVEEALKESGLIVNDEEALIKFAAKLVLVAAEIGENELLNAIFD